MQKRKPGQPHRGWKASVREAMKSALDKAGALDRANGRSTMTNDNTPQSQLVPTDTVAWGQSIERERDVLYRRHVGGPNGEEWIAEPDETADP